MSSIENILNKIEFIEKSNKIIELTLCNKKVSIARIVKIGENNYIMSIDVVDDWNYEIQEELSISHYKLIYFRPSNEIELVGYDNGVKRELISIRVRLDNLNPEYVKKIFNNLIKFYAKNYIKILSRVLDYCT